MDLLKKIVVVAAVSASLSGCGIGYLTKSSWNQMSLMSARTDIEEALKDPEVPDEHKRKLRLGLEVRKFAEDELGLSRTDNYTTYVKLNRPYVTYIVRASYEYELKPHLWWYPIVGKLPYQGYFDEREAQELSKEFDPLKYDTYVRGVSAYSTLGWFADPLLSSMMNYSDHALVETIIHETVHATIFIKGEADFNERLATFLGREGARLFYLKKEGEKSKTLTDVVKRRKDDALFSNFISRELKELDKWYKDNKGKIDQDKKWARIGEIQTRFKQEVVPKLQSGRYGGFARIQLNNARLLSYKTYMSDLSDFEKLLKKLDGDFKQLLQFCKDLEKEKHPEKALKRAVASLK